MVCDGGVEGGKAAEGRGEFDDKLVVEVMEEMKWIYEKVKVEPMGEEGEVEKRSEVESLCLHLYSCRPLRSCNTEN